MSVNNKIQNVRKSALPLAAALAVAGLAGPSIAAAELSGNINVVSKYVLRGITSPPIGSETSEATLQGGLDYSHDSGVFAGYWASGLNYSGGGPEDATSAVENDFYVGYGGEAGGLNYSVGVTYYKYLGIDDFDAPEAFLSVGYGPVSLGAKYLLDDVAWGNKGDTYWTLSYDTALPKDFSFSAVAGYYTYEEEGEFITGGDDAFRHLDLTLSHPIGNTGADMSITYVVGGKDRDGNNQDDTVVLGVHYAFDI